MNKRLFNAVDIRSVDDGFSLMLDGKPLRTANGQPLIAPNTAIAEVIADEVRAQTSSVDRSTMPATRLIGAAQDASEAICAQWRADIEAYLGTDLLCYRATAPAELVTAQTECWDRHLDAFEAITGARLKTTSGLAYVDQPEAAKRAIANQMETFSPIELLILHQATTKLGSTVLGVLLVREPDLADDLFSASVLDETFQESRWGQDAEALDRREKMRNELMTIARIAQFNRAG